ncbi:hypothetical protein [Actinokineospora inagensis]|uniref:hypothetical protein n=1 Tax=Actinokineospora inagensis TaxID=103730 RepID=UPI001FE0C771|nr:hypothetical protein [Actinokineospora inagensis]
MRFARPVLLALCATVTSLAAALPAAAAEPPADTTVDQVVVFQMEFTPVTVYKHPTGCHTLPPLSHVLINQTDRVVTIYFDPLCVFPIFPVHNLVPGDGTHVSPVGSFSV